MGNPRAEGEEKRDGRENGGDGGGAMDAEDVGQGAEGRERDGEGEEEPDDPEGIRFHGRGRRTVSPVLALSYPAKTRLRTSRACSAASVGRTGSSICLRKSFRCSAVAAANSGLGLLQ